MIVDTGAYLGLAEAVARMAERVEQATTVEAILRSTGGPVLPLTARSGPRHARPRGDRHGLYLVRGGGAHR